MSDDNNVSVKKQDIHDDNQHVPELRFPGFTDEWNENRLDNIFKIKAAGDLNKNKFSKSKDKNHKYPVFANALENKGLLGYYTEFKYPSGSITITARGNIGIPIKRNIEFNAVGRLLILIPKENLNISFFTSCLNNIHFYIESTGVPQLTAPSLKIYKIKYPSIKEQKKIGDFISLIDRKIDLLEKTLCLHQKFIEGLKESIFSNLNYPKFKLNNFMKISKIKCNDNINKRLTVKLNLKGIVPRETKTTEKEGVTTQYIRKKGQFIYGKQNLYKGAFGIIPKELDGYMSSSDIPSFDFINNKLNPYWFYYFISRKNYYSRLEKYSTGTGSKRISPEEFLNIKIPLPPIEKQNNQVKMFNKLIERQNILIKEKEYLYNFKKGLLQKMFV